MKIQNGAVAKHSSAKIVEKYDFKPVWGYVRVSTEGQSREDKYGLAAQKKAIADYCLERRMAVVKWFIDVESGVKENRPAMNEMLFMDNGDIDTVVIFKSDRLSRDTKMYFYFMYALEKKGLHLDCITEEFDTESEFANLYRSMMLFVAEQERKNILYRTSRGKEVKKSEGGFAGGRYPYGYTGNGRKEVIPEPEEAWIVLYSFYRCEHGAGYLKIANELNDRGYRTRKGTKFGSSSIRSILNHRRFYQGFVTQPDGTEVRGKHENLLLNIDIKNYPEDLKPGESLLSRRTSEFLDHRLTKDVTESERALRKSLRDSSYFNKHFGRDKDLDPMIPVTGPTEEYYAKLREEVAIRRAEKEKRKAEAKKAAEFEAIYNGMLGGDDDIE
ncbi:MAG: recombinase family protein [Lachnospiraceae bacterium]|nr:recombinase family protein [Lachnospiraceae bacterium]